ncbi:unnamed protein product, partial [Meganyctiphanes norvegica]
HNHNIITEWSQNDIKQREEIYTGYTKSELRIKDRLSKRRTLLEEKCKEHRNLLQTTEYYMLAMKTAKNLMVCQIPKVGTTTWMVHLMYIKGIKNIDPENVHHTLQNRGIWATKQYSRPSIFQTMSYPDRNLSSVVRIITVRDPLERLVSAYNDKFAGGRKIILGRNDLGNW